MDENQTNEAVDGDDVAVEETSTGTDAEATQGGEPEGDGLPTDPLERALAERDEAQSKWMRAQADFQNLRRRQLADLDAAAARAKTEVLSEAVTILDYLDMALAAPVTSEDAKNLKIGVEMTRGQLQQLFDRLSVKPIDATGEFDPSRHQAVSTVETEDEAPGTIVEVVRGGWLMGETVLRFAQVKVAAAPTPVDVEVESDDATEDPDAEGEASATDETA